MLNNLLYLQNGGGVNEAVLNSYCWMYSRFNIPLNFKGACTKREPDGSTLYNSYYQWVSLFLVVSALMFYMPRFERLRELINQGTDLRFILP